MKYKFFILLLLIAFSSCLQTVKKEPVKIIPILPVDYKKEIVLPNQVNNFSGYEVVTMDSCEYIVAWFGGYNGGGGFTHKGNCKYCEERSYKRAIKFIKQKGGNVSGSGEYSFFNLFKF